MPDFVHLRVHSEFSIIDGLVRIPPLMQTLTALDMQAIAITDYCNLFAAVKIYKASLAKGIKPIFGADLPCYDVAYPEQLTSLVALCQNEVGYRNLTCLISQGYQEGQEHGQPRIHYSWLATHATGLIILSGGRTGAIGQALLTGQHDRAATLAKFFADTFPQRFYLEIQRTGRNQETDYNNQAIVLARQLNLPLVATNDVRFLHSDDYNAHEARVCIHNGCILADPKRKRAYSQEQYLRSAQEMCAIFQDLPQAITNTVEISKRCTTKLSLGQNYLPNFPIPPSITIEAYLTKVAQQGLHERFTQLAKKESLSAKKRASYLDKLMKELEVINSMGFTGYFLIVADFVQWAKQQNIPVGPGRGSGVGSLVAYSLKITDIDPLQHELLFERFLNPERISMPDFDIDFCVHGRDQVIEYVAAKYGRQSVSQIITFGTMAAKAVIRDVGRVLGFPYGFVDKIAKLIPFELGMTLTKALNQAELRKRYQEEEVKTLIDLALKLEGITRNASKHAGGLVIAPEKLTDFTAIYCEQDSTQLVSHFDKDDVEAVGLVKFDFLGLRTLTIIADALQLLNQQRAQNNQEPIDLNLIPINDEQTFALLKQGHTTGVFQIESRGMKEIIHRLQPDSFADLVALLALFRPGPLQSGMVDDFINRKHKRAEVSYPHPDLEPILQSTYGVILYQEQVMQIAQVLANYTLGAADLLRRAMGKKKAKEMAKQRAIFILGATKRSVDTSVANAIFDLMEKFAGYGFNKSHAVAYAAIAYQTAWLKAHYPAEFMAAVMSAELDNTDKLVIFMEECKQLGLRVLPPSINDSNYHFTVTNKQKVLYGLGAIKGVGATACNSLIAIRKNGKYTDLFSFCQRVDLRKINRRVIEALIKSGALDEWQIERATLTTSLHKALAIAEVAQRSQRSGQLDLLDLLAENNTPEDYTKVEPWPENQRLQGEKETLGFYLTGHPVSRYCQEFNKFIRPINSLATVLNKKVYVCGLITGIKKITTKTGKQLTIINLADPDGKLDLIVFANNYDQQIIPLQEEQIIIAEGKPALDTYNHGCKMFTENLYSIEQIRSMFSKALILQLTATDRAIIPTIQAIIKAHPGKCRVNIKYTNSDASVHLTSKWLVALNDELLLLLRQLLGDERVLVQY